MIDYYYEFPEHTRLLDRPIRYAFMRGYHPDEATTRQHLFHSQCMIEASRVWLENANGMALIRQSGRDVYEKINHREMIWIKLLAQEL
jgi:hypothetical protein